MAKYKLADGGVIDTERNIFIPNDPRNRLWIEYKQWVSTGNTPDTDSINEIKEKTIKKLENDCHQYILSHYPETRQHTFKAKYIQIVDELTNNSSNYTQEQIDNLTLAKNRMLEAMNWVDSVLDHFYTKLDEIKSATTVDDVYAVTWDFSQFDDSDPGVTIEEIRGYLAGILWA